MLGNDPLDALIPAVSWEADWNDVVRRAGVPRRRGRGLAIAFAVVFAVLVPLVALAAANDWWFLRSTAAPQPVRAPVVVREGEWNGHGWQLVAYPSSTDGLCVSMTSTDSSGLGAMGCAPMVGVGRTSSTKDTPDLPITYLAGSGNGFVPDYIAGPVIETATRVRIRLGSGRVLEVPTFAAPAPLEHVRFYLSFATGSAPQSVAGLDREGNVVACLVPATAKLGISPLSDCR